MNWSDISVGQFMELQELKLEDCKDIDEFVLIRLAIIFDKLPEEIENLFEEEFNSMLSQISFIAKPPINSSKAELKISDEIILTKIEDFNTLTIGEYIDLEYFFENDYIKNLNLILAVIYRVKEKRNSLLFPDEFEKYGNYIFHRKELFNSVKITDVFGVLYDYINFRKKLMEQYNGLFEDVIKESEEEVDFEKESVRERAERIKAEQTEKQKQKWSWFYWIYKLAKENNISLQQATTLPLIEAFNIMAMKKELGLE